MQVVLRFLSFVFRKFSLYDPRADRNRGMINNQNKPAQCDKTLAPGWYRFLGDAGNEMPTSCVNKNHCGTHAPGWMKGTHPTVTAGATTVRVCFHWAQDCCRWSVNIRVRNCSGYYVYELKKPPACLLRYCGNGGKPGIAYCFFSTELVLSIEK